MHLTAVWFALVAMLVALGGVAPAVAQPAGTLVVGLVAEPVNLDPAQVTDLNSNRVGRRIVETLVMFPDESTQIVPGLAESWTISKDGLRYTFKLRKGDQLPRRHAVQRRGGEVLDRAADQSRASVQQARQVSVRGLLLRQRQGGGGGRSARPSSSSSRSRAPRS